MKKDCFIHACVREKIKKTIVSYEIKQLVDAIILHEFVGWDLRPRGQIVGLSRK